MRRPERAEPPAGSHRIRQLLGTLVGLAVLLGAGLGVLWWMRSDVTGGGSNHPSNTAGARQAAVPTEPPVGVPAGAQQLTVAGASDGDTIDASPVLAGVPVATTDRIRVRLIGISAPALRTASGRAACFATDAQQALQRLTPAGSAIWVIADAQLLTADGQYLLYAWNSAGTFVNLALADGGFVRSQPMMADTARQGAISEAVSAAARGRRGLWGQCNGN